MRRLIYFSLAMILSVGILFAKDFWKEKPYSEWTQEEARRMVFDSPWGHIVRITTLAGAPLGGTTTPEVGGSGGPTSTTAGTGGYPGLGGEQPGTPGGAAAELLYNVWWTSAKTFREGFARFQQLRGAMSAEQAKQFAEMRSAEYVIALRGDNMSAFQGTSEDMLRSITYLRPRRTKKKMAPTKVEIQRSPDGQRITTILFMFPRAVNGEPVISPEEKGVDFVCEMKEHSIATTFEVRNMKAGADFDL